MQFTDKDVYLSYLPLAHIFDRVIEELFISKGASVGFWHKVSKETWWITFWFHILENNDALLMESSGC